MIGFPDNQYALALAYAQAMTDDPVLVGRCLLGRDRKKLEAAAVQLGVEDTKVSKTDYYDVCKLWLGEDVTAPWTNSPPKTVNGMSFERSVKIQSFFRGIGFMADIEEDMIGINGFHVKVYRARSTHYLEVTNRGIKVFDNAGSLTMPMATVN